MRYAKILGVFLLPFLLISLLWSQDLAAAAKKEKERRQAAAAKKVVVITNYDLQSVKKKPAVREETETTPTTEGEGAMPEAKAEEGVPPAQAPEPQAQPANEQAMPLSEPLPTKLDDTQKSILEGNYIRAKEYADLLETKVNALWQTFYSMDDMTPKDQIQQEISDTFDKYQAAREDEAKAKEELDRYVSTVKKD